MKTSEFQDTKLKHTGLQNPTGLRESGGGETWRVFVAVPIPPIIKQNLAAWCRERQTVLRFKKWVHPEDFHITVQFLGDIRSNRVSEIDQALKRAAAVISPFEVKLEGIGAFGRPNQPRVLWAAIEEGMEGLERLNRSVTLATAPLGFKTEERPYSPHVTLARQSLQEGDFNSSLQKDNTDLAFGSWQAQSIVLYRTRLGHQPMYDEVTRAAFNGQ